MPFTGGGPPTVDEVLLALRRILDSSAFMSAPRSRAFLEFVVTEALRGRTQRIKEATVARYALERDGLQAGDPSVRVQAMRVRTALERYYADQGRDDDVRIALPRGSYVPEFSRAPVSTDLDAGILVAALGPHEDAVARGLSESLVHVLGGFPGIRVGGPPSWRILRRPRGGTTCATCCKDRCEPLTGCCASRFC